MKFCQKLSVVHISRELRLPLVCNEGLVVNRLQRSVNQKYCK